MGNKRITEKDFWKCTNGAVPAQLQGTNTSVKKIYGEKYITIKDKATSSWIDFGCTKLMLIYAILAAAAVVVAALVVGTGGAALIALGALAGLAGAAWGAIEGSMLCGHLGAKIRDWIPIPKENGTYVQGAEQITGDYKMTCKIPGGIITFDPNIKSWSQAVSLGASNYIGKLMEGMFAGALIGMGGAALSGGASAFSAGGLRGLSQAAWQFAKSAPMNVIKNIAASFGYAGAGATTSTVYATAATAVGLRTATAAQAGLGHYGNTGESGWGEAGKGVFAMETGMYESGKNITGSALGWKKEDGSNYSVGWQDIGGIALMLSPVHKAPEELLGKPEEVKTKADDAAKDTESKKVDDEGLVQERPVNEAEQAKEGEIGDAYEETKLSAEELKALIAARTQIAIEFYQKHNPGMDIANIKSHIKGIDFTKPIEIVNISQGKELIQYTKVNTEGTVLRGDYYTDNPNNTPSQLGVSDKYNVRDPNNGWNYTDEIRSVNQERVTIPKDSEGLKSTSAEIDDTWSLKDQSVHTEGGGSQIYIPKSQF